MSAHAKSLFILADDLSGAADCAVGAAKSGLRSIVSFDPDAQEQAEVLAVDSDSRYRAPAEAQAINASLWRAHAAPDRLFYKKIDSTLRGNFAAEIAALTEAGVAIIAPAFPGAGRTTRGGKVFVKGVPLEATETWANEHMQGDASIVAMLGAHSVPAVSVPLDKVRADLRAELTRLVSSGAVKAVICDAEDDNDLALIAKASVGLPVYWVGSAGLAAHLPRAAGLAGDGVQPALSVSGSILTVVGSLSTVSLQQAMALQENVDVTAFVAAPGLLRGGESHPGWQALSAQVGEALRAGRDVLIRTGVEEHNDLANGHTLCTALGRLLKPWAPHIGALVATGGETARELLPMFGAHALRIVREIEPGVPLSVSIGDRQIPVVTKAGAFGSPSALLNCHAELTAIKRKSSHAP